MSYAHLETTSRRSSGNPITPSSLCAPLMVRQRSPLESPPASVTLSKLRTLMGLTRPFFICDADGRECADRFAGEDAGEPWVRAGGHRAVEKRGHDSRIHRPSGWCDRRRLRGGEQPSDALIHG